MIKKTPVDIFLENPIAFHASLGRLVGVTAGVFLSQAVYWSKRTSRKDGYFYKTQEDWTWETCLTRSQQETARNKLKEMNILHEKRLGGLNPVVYFFVDTVLLNSLLEENEKKFTRKSKQLSKKSMQNQDTKDSLESFDNLDISDAENPSIHNEKSNTLDAENSHQYITKITDKEYIQKEIVNKLTKEKKNIDHFEDIDFMNKDEFSREEIDAINDWINHQKEMKSYIKKDTKRLTHLINTLQTMHKNANLVQSIAFCIASGYKGLFEIKTFKNKPLNDDSKIIEDEELMSAIKDLFFSLHRNLSYVAHLFPKKEYKDSSKNTKTILNEFKNYSCKQKSFIDYLDQQNMLILTKKYNGVDVKVSDFSRNEILQYIHKNLKYVIDDREWFIDDNINDINDILRTIENEIKIAM